MAGGSASVRVPSLLPEAKHGATRAGESSIPLPLVLASWEKSLRRTRLADLETALSQAGPDRIRRWFDSDLSIEEIAELHTCQRLLVLAVTRGIAAAELLGNLLGEPGTWEYRVGEQAIRHLFLVTAGLDSIAPAEREVREQIRSAASHVVSRHPRPLLRNLLREAAAAASHADGSDGPSVADLAADWLRTRLPAKDSVVLIVGAGIVGRRIAERLSGTAQLVILYHERPPQPEWIGRLGARALPVRDLAGALSCADALVAAAKTGGRLLRLADLHGGRGRVPRWMVDLGLPRNIDPEVAHHPGVELVDLAGLPRGTLRLERRVAIERTVGEAAARSTKRFARNAVEPWVSQLRIEGERIREEEWRRALEFAGSVSGTSRLAFERMSERIVRRLLAGPSEQLRSIRQGTDADRIRKRLAELFRRPDRAP